MVTRSVSLQLTVAQVLFLPPSQLFIHTSAVYLCTRVMNWAETASQVQRGGEFGRRRGEGDRAAEVWNSCSGFKLKNWRDIVVKIANRFVPGNRWQSCRERSPC